MADPDDAPKLTSVWAAGADAYRDGMLVRRGRPRLEHPKQHVSLRLDAEVVDFFRSGGPGWQSRMNETLRKAVGL